MSSVPPSQSPPPPGSPSSWGGEPPRPRLARRRTDKVLGGVCGGLADHLGIDVIILRVAAVLLAMTGWGVLFYLVAWAALPVADPNAVRPAERWPGARAALGRIPWLPVVIVAALLFTIPTGFSMIFGEGHFGNATVPVLLLGGIAYLMWRATHGESPLPRRPGGPRPQGHGHGHGQWHAGGWQAPPPPDPGETATAGSAVGMSAAAPASTPASTERPLWARDDQDEDSASPAAPTGPAGDAGEPDEDPILAEARRLSDPFLTEPLLFETAPATTSTAALPAPPSGHQRRGGARAALAAILIGAGAVGLAVAIGVPFNLFTVLAGLLVTFGVGLIFGGFAGRSSRGLIIPGLIVFGLLSLATIVDLPSASAGERVYRPEVLSDVATSYDLGAGELVIDLSAVDFPTNGPFEIDAHVGAGELTVTVPDGVSVVVDASAGAGDLTVFDRFSEGINHNLAVTDEGVEGGGVLNLDLRVGLGEITVGRS